MINIRIGTHLLHATRVSDESDRLSGLAMVEHVPEWYGMLFDMDGPSRRAFTFAHTRVPLDVLFLDERGRVQQIVAAVPAGSPEPVVPLLPYCFALETAAHWAARRGVVAGDLAVW